MMDALLQKLEVATNSIGGHLSGLKLAIEVNNDFAELKSLWPSFDRGSLNPVFDPAVSFLTPGNSFWVGLRQSEQCCVAVVSCRLYELRNLRTAFVRHQFHSPGRPTLMPGYADYISDDVPELSGRILYGGTSFVSKSLRSKGVSTSLVRLCKLLALKFFDLDWFVADCYEDVAKSKLPKERYLYEEVTPVFKKGAQCGEMPPALYLMWGSAADFAARIIQEEVETLDRQLAGEPQGLNEQPSAEEA